MSEAQRERVKATGIQGPSPAEPRFPFPVPSGWFAVAQSTDLVAGGTRNVHYFGRDLVVWREQSTGTPHVVDAYCAHLGAHLGVGSGSPDSHAPGPGTVHDACLQCPFHGWRYDGSGAVVEIPYAPSVRIPAKARVRGYPTREANGLILCWYHALDQPPAWELPDVDEFDDEAWEGPVYTERYIDTALQELVENDQDTVHFVFVHGSDAVPEQTTRWDGRLRHTTALRPDGSTFTRETHQLGFSLMRTPNLMFLGASSPLDEAHTHQRWVFAYRKSIGAEAGRSMIDAFACSGIYQDIPIWEHKSYREHPLLVKGDGPIMEFRRWAAQFYPSADGS
jgi:phenylpropionate dioxygenase-like ring-hydroxylating dioxygenase large terminal subunit